NLTRALQAVTLAGYGNARLGRDQRGDFTLHSIVAIGAAGDAQRLVCFLASHHAQASAVLDHSRPLPQGDGSAPPALAGGAAGGEGNLIILHAGTVLHDAFAVRAPGIDAEGEMSSQCAHVRLFLPQSSSASRLMRHCAP